MRSNCVFCEIFSGYAQVFTTKDCKSNRFDCGKRHYQSPEVVNRRKNFDAKKNDIWCVGVALFVMLTGTAPWDIAKDSDEGYKYMVGGFMKGILKQWDLLKFVDDDLLDLFDRIFVEEKNRITLNEIAVHKWVRK